MTTVLLAAQIKINMKTLRTSQFPSYLGVTPMNDRAQLKENAASGSLLGMKPVNLSMLIQESRGSQARGRSSILSCPLDSATTAHHFVNCSAMLRLWTSHVKTASMFRSARIPTAHRGDDLCDPTYPAKRPKYARPDHERGRLWCETGFQRLRAGGASILVRSVLNSILSHNAKRLALPPIVLGSCDAARVVTVAIHVWLTDNVKTITPARTAVLP